MRDKTWKGLLSTKRLILALILFAAALGACGPNKTIGFQGRLTDENGVPLNGTYDLTFKIYNDDDAGDLMHTDTHNNVQVTNGLFNVEIGAGDAGDGALEPKEWARPLWVEIVVEGETLSPRQKLLGAPYAMSLVGGAVVGSTAIDNSDPNYGVLNAVNASSGTTLVLGSMDASADLIRGCQTDVNGECDSVVFVVSTAGEVFADDGYHCGANINCGTACDEIELDPCLSDLSPAADFAEVLAATDGLEPGDVLVIGPDGLLARSTTSFAANVAGVYSTRPSYVGNAAMLGADGYVPLGVIGIVPVKASAENGAIQPGDLLTSSSIPGHAMNAGLNPPTGTVIGKALGSLESGTGIIQMLVMMQ